MTAQAVGEVAQDPAQTGPVLCIVVTPYPIEPMLLTSATHLPQDEQNWAFEVKYDGYRALVHRTDKGIRIQSRQLRDLTSFYPELQVLADVLPPGHVLDAELVALTPEGGHNLEALGRWKRRSAGGRPDAQVCLQFFDALYVGGQSVMHLPYVARRALLGGLGLNGPHWTTPSVHIGGDVLAQALLDASRAAGLEGMVAKKLTSPYRPGERSRDWLKVKNWRTGTFILGGWNRDGEGAAGWLGSLVVGLETSAGLVHVGAVELGMHRVVNEMRDIVVALHTERSPFGDGEGTSRRTSFLEPRLEVEVRYLDMGVGGRFRHAQVMALRVRLER